MALRKEVDMEKFETIAFALGFVLTGVLTLGLPLLA